MERVASQTIVGREEPLRLLDGVLAAAREGEPRLALLAGEAGVGKTRLAAEAEARARERGWVVLHGESVVFGGEQFPYAPVVAALRDVPDAWLADHLEGLDGEPREELAALLPSARSTHRAHSSGRLGQTRLCELVLDLLGRLAGDRGPVLLVLEDLHWADRSSRELVAFLARNLRSERIAAVLSYRTGELRGAHPLRRLAAELARQPSVVPLALEPLGRDDVARQLESIAGRPVPRSLADEIHARSGGNPFFVEELFAAHAGDGVPATLAEAVLGRVRALPSGAQRVLAVLAAAGGTARHEVLERVVPAAELGPALRAALDGGLVVRDDRGVALRHGLMGEVVYGDLVPHEQAELHGELAHALAATGAPPARLADQWHRAGAHQEALAASVAAGVTAARLYGFAEAFEHFERALALWAAGAMPAGELPLDRVDLLSQAAQAARYAGHRGRALELGREALAALDAAAEPLRAARLYERLGEYHSWDDLAALDEYRRALRLLPPGPSAERARLLAAEAHALMGVRRWEEARGRCEAALAAASDAGEDAEAAAAGITLGLVLAFLGDPERGEAELRRALETARATGAGELTARAYVHLGELLRLRGDHAGALRAMADGEAAAARLGMRGTFGQFMFVNAADDLLRLGRWDEAAERLAEAERLDLGVTAEAMQRATAGHLWALRGDAGRARAHLTRASELLAESLPGEFVAPIHGAWAALALAEGDSEAARGHVETALAAIGEATDPLYTPALHWLGVRAEADAAERARALRREEELAGSRARAEALVAGLERIVARGGRGTPPDALAHLALARAEHDRLVADPRPDRWQDAARKWDALGEPYPAAYARLRAAEALLTAGGDRRAATERLAEAYAKAIALGARPLLASIEALARRARVPLGAPDRLQAQPEAAEPELPLTRREADVLALLAEGLTNREIASRLFISEKTVGTHLGHIFDKLDVHTRVEAAGRAHALGLVRRRG